MKLNGHSVGLTASKTRLAIIRLPFTQLGSQPNPGRYTPRFLGSFAGVLWCNRKILIVLWCNCKFLKMYQSALSPVVLWCLLLPAYPSTILTVVHLVELSWRIVVLQYLHCVARYLEYMDCVIDHYANVTWLILLYVNIQLLKYAFVFNKLV